MRDVDALLAAAATATEEEREALLAAVVIDSLGRVWNPLKHPRDAKGRFIETFAEIRGGFHSSGGVKGSKPKYTGHVIGINKDGTAYVRISSADPNTGYHTGQYIAAPFNDIEVFTPIAQIKRALNPREKQRFSRLAEQIRGDGHAEAAASLEAAAKASTPEEQLNHLQDARDRLDNVGTPSAAAVRDAIWEVEDDLGERPSDLEKVKEAAALLKDHLPENLQPDERAQAIARLNDPKNLPAPKPTPALFGQYVAARANAARQAGHKDAPALEKVAQHVAEAVQAKDKAAKKRGWEAAKVAASQISNPQRRSEIMNGLRNMQDAPDVRPERKAELPFDRTPAPTPEAGPATPSPAPEAPDVPQPRTADYKSKEAATNAATSGTLPPHVGFTVDGEHYEVVEHQPRQIGGGDRGYVIVKDKDGRYLRWVPRGSDAGMHPDKRPFSEVEVVPEKDFNGKTVYRDKAPEAVLPDANNRGPSDTEIIDRLERNGVAKKELPNGITLYGGRDWMGNGFGNETQFYAVRDGKILGVYNSRDGARLNGERVQGLLGPDGKKKTDYQAWLEAVRALPAADQAEPTAADEPPAEQIPVIHEAGSRGATDTHRTITAEPDNPAVDGPDHPDEPADPTLEFPDSGTIGPDLRYDNLPHRIEISGKTWENMDAIKRAGFPRFDRAKKVWYLDSPDMQKRREAVANLRKELGLPEKDVPETNVEIPEVLKTAPPEAVEEYPPTDQQQAIIDAVNTGEDVVVQALAGTGKTSTLKMIARRLLKSEPKKKILYIAFNKSIQTEAQASMPGNVESRTANSLAWQAMPKDMIARLEANDKLRWNSKIAEAFGITDKVGDLTPEDQVRLAREAVQAFLVSADDEVGPQHFASPEQAAQLLPLAQRVWDDYRSPDGLINIDQDVFVKMWALTRPDLSKSIPGKGYGADLIFFDEAQDINPVLARIVADQSMQKVYVGDSNQAIYGFRGAVDQLDQVEAPHNLPLTKSWRFGPQIAAMGNRFLQLVGTKLRIEGGGPDGVVHAPGSMDTPDAVLVRSNRGMIKEIVREQGLGRLVGVPKNAKKELESVVETAKWLQGMGAKPKRPHADLAGYKTWQDAQRAVADGKANMRVKMLVGIVDDNGVDALDAMLRNVIVDGDKADARVPDVTISTAHNAKGLEWDRVRIGDDFRGPKIDPNTGDVIMPDPEEMRLAYVAVTRAMKELDPGSLAWVYDYTNENGAENSPTPTPEAVLPTPEPVAEIPDATDPEAAEYDRRHAVEVAANARLNPDAPAPEGFAPDRIYRGMRIDLPPDLLQQFQDAMQMPGDVNEMGRHFDAGELLLDYLLSEKSDPQFPGREKGLGLGQFWSTRRAMAEAAQRQGGKGQIGLVIEGYYDPAAEIPGEQFFKNAENEIAIGAGGHLRITGITLEGNNTRNLLRDPVDVEGPNRVDPYTPAPAAAAPEPPAAPEAPTPDEQKILDHLGQIWQDDKQDRLTAYAIASALGMSADDVTPILDGLVEKGALQHYPGDAFRVDTYGLANPPERVIPTENELTDRIDALAPYAVNGPGYVRAVADARAEARDWIRKGDLDAANRRLREAERIAQEYEARRAAKPATEPAAPAPTPEPTAPEQTFRNDPQRAFDLWRGVPEGDDNTPLIAVENNGELWGSPGDWYVEKQDGMGYPYFEVWEKGPDGEPRMKTRGSDPDGLNPADRHEIWWRIENVNSKPDANTADYERAAAAQRVLAHQGSTEDYAAAADWFSDIARDLARPYTDGDTTDNQGRIVRAAQALDIAQVLREHGSPAPEVVDDAGRRTRYEDMIRDLAKQDWPDDSAVNQAIGGLENIVNDNGFEDSADAEMWINGAIADLYNANRTVEAERLADAFLNIRDDLPPVPDPTPGVIDPSPDGPDNLPADPAEAPPIKEKSAREALRGMMDFALRGIGMRNLAARDFAIDGNGRVIRPLDVVEVPAGKRAGAVARPGGLGIVKRIYKNKKTGQVHVEVYMYDEAFIDSPHEVKALADLGHKHNSPVRAFKNIDPDALLRVDDADGRAQRMIEKFGAEDARRYADPGAGRLAKLRGRVKPMMQRMLNNPYIQDRMLPDRNGKLIGEGDIVVYNGKKYRVGRPNQLHDNNGNPRVNLYPVDEDGVKGVEATPLARNVEFFDDPKDDVYLRGAGGRVPVLVSDLGRILDDYSEHFDWGPELRAAVAADDPQQVLDALKLDENGAVTEFLSQASAYIRKFEDEMLLANQHHRPEDIPVGAPEHARKVYDALRNFRAAVDGVFVAGPPDARRIERFIPEAAKEYRGNAPAVKVPEHYGNAQEMLNKAVADEPGNSALRDARDALNAAGRVNMDEDWEKALELVDNAYSLVGGDYPDIASELSNLHDQMVAWKKLRDDRLAVAPGGGHAERPVPAVRTPFPDQIDMPEPAAPDTMDKVEFPPADMPYAVWQDAYLKVMNADRTNFAALPDAIANMRAGKPLTDQQKIDLVDALNEDIGVQRAERDRVGRDVSRPYAEVKASLDQIDAQIARLVELKRQVRNAPNDNGPVEALPAPNIPLDKDQQQYLRDVGLMPKAQAALDDMAQGQEPDPTDLEALRESIQALYDNLGDGYTTDRGRLEGILNALGGVQAPEPAAPAAPEAPAAPAHLDAAQVADLRRKSPRFIGGDAGVRALEAFARGEQPDQADYEALRDAVQKRLDYYNDRGRGDKYDFYQGVLDNLAGGVVPAAEPMAPEYAKGAIDDIAAEAHDRLRKAGQKREAGDIERIADRIADTYVVHMEALHDEGRYSERDKVMGDARAEAAGVTDTVAKDALNKVLDGLQAHFEEDQFASTVNSALDEAKAANADDALDVTKRDALVADLQARIDAMGSKFPKQKAAAQKRLDELKKQFAADDERRAKVEPVGRTEGQSAFDSVVQEREAAFRRERDRAGANDFRAKADAVAEAIDQADDAHKAGDKTARDAAIQRAREAIPALESVDPAVAEEARRVVEGNAARFAADDAPAAGEFVVPGGMDKPEGWDAVASLQAALQGKGYKEISKMTSIGDWESKGHFGGGINKLYKWTNKKTGQVVLLKYDDDYSRGGGYTFYGNGAAAEEMVARLYRDLGFAQPAALLINPEGDVTKRKSADKHGVLVMEMAKDGFFDLTDITTVGWSINLADIAPEFQTELFQFVAANGIIGNTDRHGNNLMWGRTKNGKRRLVVIDNGLALMNGGFGKAETGFRNNDPLKMKPGEVLRGSFGNSNAALRAAGEYIRRDRDKARSELEVFVKRMQERAKILHMVDARAGDYVAARAQWVLDHLDAYLDSMTR